MKTVLRIVIILAASLLVIGVTAALGQGSSQSRFEPRSGELRGDQRAAFTGNGEQSGTNPPQRVRPEGRFEGRREFEGGRGGFNLFGIASFAQTLVPITIMIVIVTAANNANRWRKRAAKTRTNAE